MQNFAPETLEIMKIRYSILWRVLHQQPVGRRQLGRQLGLSERIVRRELEILKARGFISWTPGGIYLCSTGEAILQDLDQFIPFLFDTRVLTEIMQKEFNLQEVLIVPGDSSTNHLAKREMGRAAANYLQRNWFAGSVIAVSGGTTLAAMADAICNNPRPIDIMAIPARGGLGEEMELQAGTIAATIARAVKGQYRLLHIPDYLEEETAHILKEDVHIKKIVDTIRSCHILVHGIGVAEEMAKRRGLSAGEIDFLHRQGATGEALRYYFDNQGKIVYEVPGIGLELTDLANVNIIVAVAGGSNKAEAIKAVLKSGYPKVLITDEGAVKKIINGKGGKFDSKDSD
ncbi:MAG: sugar-binding transcriptional regulator [Syntrophomonadaceae bacterium]